MIRSAARQNTRNTDPYVRTAKAVRNIALIGAVTLTGAAECHVGDPPESFNTPPAIPAGTNFYTGADVEKEGGEPCGQTTKEITNVAPVKSVQEPSANTLVVIDGYSQTVISSSLNPGNTCGSGDPEGIMWQQMQRVMIGGLPN